MHDLVFAARRDRPRRVRTGHVLEPREKRHFGAQRLAVELDRLLAATLEDQVRLNLHKFSSACVGDGYCYFASTFFFKSTSPSSNIGPTMYGMANAIHLPTKSSFWP